MKHASASMRPEGAPPAEASRTDDFWERGVLDGGLCLFEVFDPMVSPCGTLADPHDHAFRFHRGLIVREGKGDINLFTDSEYLHADKAKTVLADVARMSDLDDTPVVPNPQAHG